MLNLPPIHPGEILLEDYMKPAGISINRLASDLSIPTSRLSNIVNSKNGVTADTALRLAKAFGTSPQFWLNLQNAYDISRVQSEKGQEITDRVRIPKELVDA